jgi:cobalt-zinc-cadmium efflux system protein
MRSKSARQHRAFAVGVALNLGFVALEAAFGVFAGSLALLADASHNLSDVFGLLIAWGAVWLTQREPTRRRTYGFRRSSILASLLNAVILYLAVGAIVWEAVRRLWQPEPVHSETVIWVAAVGVVINTVTTLMFMSGHRHDINIRAIVLHMAADAGVSLGVVVAGIVIMLTGWWWLDPVTSLAIAAVITLATWGLLRDSINLALDSVPPGIDREAVEDFLSALPGICQVHHLHIWAMSTTDTALTVHLVKTKDQANNALIRAASEGLEKQFGIAHATFQIEDALEGATKAVCQ